MRESATLQGYHSITSEDEFAVALSRSMDGPVVIYKHSATCELSEVAQREMRAMHGRGGPDVFEIVVQTARPLSNHVEDHFGIRHESPQVIVVNKGEPVFNASHLRVTEARVQEAIGDLAAS